MKNAVSRADLLSYLLVSEQWQTVADCFGFEQIAAKDQEIKTQPEAGSKNKEPVPEIIEPKDQTRSETRPAEKFYYINKVTSSELLTESENGNPDSKLPQWITDKNLPALDLTAPTKQVIKPPKHQPLTAWSRLWPVLYEILSTEQKKKRPDIKKLINRLANGHLPVQIPLQKRSGWTTEVRLLIDRPKRLDLFNEDYKQLIEQLKKIRGENGLTVQMVDDYPGGRVISLSGKNNGDTRWQMPQPDVPVFILGDCGIHAENRQAEQQWIRFGCKLKAAGCQAYVLMPVSSDYVPHQLATLFHCISWDRFSDLNKIQTQAGNQQLIKQRKQQNQQYIDQLLLDLAPALEIEPGLLRAVRYQNQQQQCNVNIEAGFWNHEDIKSCSNYAEIKADKQQQYRDQYTQQYANANNKDRLISLYQLFKIHHGHKFLLDYYEEINLIAQLAGIKDDQVAQQAEHYLKQFIKAVYQNELHQGLLQHSQSLIQRQPEQLKQQQQYFSSLWGILKTRLEKTDALPEWLSIEYAAPFLDQPVVNNTFQLVQQGECFYFGSQQSLNKRAVNGLEIAISPLLQIQLEHLLLREQRVNKQKNTEVKNYFVEATTLIKIPLQAEQHKLHINGHCYHLGTISKPDDVNSIGRDQQGLYLTADWAGYPHKLYWTNPTVNKKGYWSGDHPLGYDQYGLYADVAIYDVTLRFRWIRTGTFMMGSPENEKGRYEDETLHQVNITQGFWMAETTVTQVLWTAVMKINPSQFQADNLPVETVSWDDAQVFIKKLKQLLPGLAIQLPTEAQWEYACRAGTETAFNFDGELNLDKVNYSGVWEDLERRKEAKKQTVAVKSYPCNDWGLFEMHGNVWEWCQDVWVDDLKQETVSDPLESGQGAMRVMRGGSWHRYGKDLRSAYRRRCKPVYRDGDIGLRLSLGHLSSSGGAGSRYQGANPVSATDSHVAEQGQSAGKTGWLEKLKGLVIRDDEK